MRGHVFVGVALLWAASAHAAVYTKQVGRNKEEIIAKISSDINKVDHTIEVTKELIKRSSDAYYLADLYFRLAELYVEKSRYVFGRMIEQQPEGERTLSSEKSLEVQLNKKLAIETYDKILSDFPEYDKNDQVRFFKAHEFRELGEWDTMLKELQTLIEKFPSSDWAIEARLIIGDYHFDKGEIEQAEQFYDGILKLPESHLHDMARYKIGWIRINQEKFKESLALFESAVTSSAKKKRGAVGDAKSLDVKREAIIAMVWPFSEVRKAGQASEYFRKLASSKTLYVQVLKRLANRYFIKTDYVNAALLYREIVRYSADVDQNIEFIQRVYDSVRNMSAKNPRRYSNAAEDVDAIVKTLARFENHLKFANEDKGQLEQDMEVRARDLATKLHVDAQQKKDDQSAIVAADAYKKYLSIFNNAKEKKTMQVNRSEALYQGNKFLDAGLQYELIAKDVPEGNERRDMVYNAILSFHKAISDDNDYRIKHPTKPGILSKLELLRAREGLKQLGAYYVKNWPQSDKAPNVKFNIARMYYQQGEYERAAELFEVFVKQYPNHKDTATAGNLALDALHKLDKYDEMAKLAQSFVSNAQITDSKFKNEAARLAEAARKRKVEFTVLETSEGEFSSKMLAEWEKNKGTQEGEEYLYTAFVKYKTEGNIAGVFDFGGRIIGAYPESKKLVDVFATMGNFAVRAADFERAAFLYEEFQKRFPQEKAANDVMTSAANIRYYLGDYEAAAKDYRIVRSTAPAQQKMAANEKLMEIYRDVADWEGLARVAQTALQDNERWAGAAAYLGVAYAGAGKDELAQKELTRAARLAANTAFDKVAVGRGLFTFGRLLQKRYDEVQFKGAASAEQVLGLKLQLLQQIEQAYVGAINSGQGEWAIASLHEAARLYKDFAAFLAGAPVPDGMSAADRKQYQDALQQQSQPYQQKAQETLTACSKKAEQLNVFTAYASACLSGGAQSVADSPKRKRGEVAGDEAYQAELTQLRQELVKRPENVDVLRQLARRAMQVGDYHLAKLTLSKAIEIDPRNAAVQNLLGVAAWQLGDVQEAYAAFDQGNKRRLAEATLNLAALYNEFGYTRQAKQLMQGVSGTAPDTSAPEYHPNVAKMLQELSGS